MNDRPRIDTSHPSPLAPQGGVRIRRAASRVIGRSVEMTAIEEGIEEARHGISGLSLEGEPGIGKSRLAALDRLIADDVVWHEIGNAEPRRGKLALRAAAGPEADFEISGVAHDTLASDDHAVTLVEATATRGGTTFTYRTAEIYHIANGQVTERWAFSDDTEAIRAFFA